MLTPMQGLMMTVYAYSAVGGWKGLENDYAIPPSYFHMFRPSTDKDYPWLACAVVAVPLVATPLVTTPLVAMPLATMPPYLHMLHPSIRTTLG